MEYTSKYIAELLNSVVELSHPQEIISSIQIDSRIINSSKGCLFAAIDAGKNNGHQYISAAYDKGVRNFLVQEKKWITKYSKANFFLVKNVVAALQKIAKHHREKFTSPVIGITGSNGKTIVKEWINFLLSSDKFVHKSPGSFNSQIGVPLSIYPLQNEHEVAIIEAGISEKNEMSNLSEIIQCEIGVFTYLGSAHDKGFSSQLEKLQEKLLLFKFAKKIIYPHDNELVREELTKYSAELIGWSRNDESSYCYVKKEQTLYDGTTLTLVINNLENNFWIPFRSVAQINNSISAIVTAIAVGQDIKIIKSACSNLPEVDMRLSLSKGISNSLIIHDYYNADWHGLTVALDFMQIHAEGRKKILVLSELNNNSLSSKEIFESLNELLKSKKVDRLIGIGQSWASFNFDKSVQFEQHDDIQSFLNKFNIEELAGAIILLKGERAHRFEQLSKVLRLQEHSARLEINLSTLKSNLDFFRSQISPGTKIMAMVKASAYGSGGAEVSQVLAYNQVDYLCVAYVDEGIELRRKGIRLPIMVLNAEAESFPKMVQYQLEPEIYKISQLKSIQQLNVGIPIHLKLNTGMNRLGFGEKDLVEVIDLINHKQTIVRSVFSHLSGSESPNADDFTHKQIAKFNRFFTQISLGIEQKPLKHILNTNGILRFKNHQMDMVRLGIGLYGLGLPSSFADQVHSIFSLKARISQIRNIQAGESVGYGRSFIAEQNMKMAIVNIGYADGLLRKAGNQAYSIRVNGVQKPLIGNICMDMCMVDISGLNNVEEGDTVEIFSSNLDINKLATCLETIPYEVLTNISARIPRIYIRD